MNEIHRLGKGWVTRQDNHAPWTKMKRRFARNRIACTGFKSKLHPPKKEIEVAHAVSQKRRPSANPKNKSRKIQDGPNQENERQSHKQTTLIPNLTPTKSDTPVTVLILTHARKPITCHFEPQILNRKFIPHDYFQVLLQGLSAHSRLPEIT